MDEHFGRYIPLMVLAIAAICAARSLSAVICFILVWLILVTVIRPLSRRRVMAKTDELNQFLGVAGITDLDLLLQMKDMSGVPEACTENMHRALIRAVTQVGPDTRLHLALIPRQTMRTLVVGSNTELAIAVLNAYKWIGDREDLGTVQRVAAGMSHVHAHAVQEEALRVLPSLEARLSQDHAGDELLRASSAPDSDTLLRADIKPAPEHPETLLRSASRSSEA